MKRRQKTINLHDETVQINTIPVNHFDCFAAPSRSHGYTKSVQHCKYNIRLSIYVAEWICDVCDNQDAQLLY